MLAIFACLDVFQHRMEYRTLGDFQFCCLGCSLFCTFFSLTSRTRTIWGQDWSSNLEVISCSAHEASTFVEGLMHPLGMWKQFRRQLEAEFSESKDVAYFSWTLAPGFCCATPKEALGLSASSLSTHAGHSDPSRYQQGMTHQWAASESWLGPDVERQSECST